MLTHAHEPTRRKAMRHPADFPVLAARTGGEDIKLRIVSISPTGFMAGGAIDLSAGERVTIRLPIIGEIEAQQVWSDAMRAGFAFERLIRLGDFTRMIVAMQSGRPERD
jgi:hypothetical protein